MTANTERTPFISLTKNDTLLIVLSFLFPPLGVYLRQGLLTRDFLIVVLLTMIRFFPGIIYAVYVIYTTSLLRGEDFATSESYSRLEEGVENSENGASGAASNNINPSHNSHQNVAGNAGEDIRKVSSSEDNDNKPLINEHFPLDNKIQT